MNRGQHVTQQIAAARLAPGAYTVGWQVVALSFSVTAGVGFKPRR
jgi:methionine-rich copper-binding protein CopC